MIIQPNMKTLKAFVILMAVLFLFSSPAYATKYVDGFSASKAGDYPKGWRARPGQGDDAEKIYHIMEDNGTKYLHADDENGASIQIFKLASWDPNKYPILTWKWRATKLPVGANETIPAKNDSACGVYVSFGIVKGKALKYVWSTTAPKGTYYKKNDDMYIIVKATGDSGSWKTETANIVEDATKVFGKLPGRTLSGIAILTDGNATHTPAACDYKEIGYEPN